MNTLQKNTTFTTLILWFNRFEGDIINNTILEIDERLKINAINKKRLSSVQILCLEKLEQLGRINEVKFSNPVVYDSCLMKY